MNLLVRLARLGWLGSLCTLCGFMAGSLRSLWPWSAAQPPTGPLGAQIGVFLGLSVAGGMGVFLLEKASAKKGSGSPETEVSNSVSKD